MPTAYVTFAVEYTERGLTKTFGSKTVPTAVTYAGGKVERTLDVAAGAAAEILSLGGASSDHLADFDEVFILATEDGSIELQGPDAADNSNFAIKANEMFRLSSDETRVYAAGGNFTGAASSITKIRYKNNGVNQASLSLLALT